MNSKQSTSIWFLICGILGALAVALGAIGAHLLKSKIPTGLITEAQINSFDTGVKYQMYHVIVMLIALLVYRKNAKAFLFWTLTLFLLGILFFSGSIYFLSTKDLLEMPGLKILGPVTPIGGILFMAGWLVFGYGMWKHKF